MSTKRSQITLAILLTLISLMSTLSVQRWKTRTAIEWDVTLYYSYLPMGFFHQEYQAFVWNSEEDHNQLGYYFDTIPPRMTMGMSVVWFPAYITAQMLTKPLGYKADGISPPYHLAIHFSLFLYLFWGWWALQRVWDSFGFSLPVKITGAALLLLGTNLLYYTSDETALTHSMNFILVALLLDQSIRWWESKNNRCFNAIAAILGLMILIRPVNGMFILLPFIVGLRYHPLAAMLRELSPKLIIRAAIIIFLFFLPQMLFWKIFHGKWFIYSYGDEGFFWTNPQIFNGLFSYRKGWLVYTPLGMFMLLGLWFFIWRHRRLGIGVAFFTALFIYVTFSWWCWWYGGSFGQREMIDLYPVLSLGLLSLLSWSFAHLKRAIPTVVIATFFVCYNALLTFQYRDGLIHYDGMSKCAYNLHFMQWRAPQQHWWHNLYIPDYEAAKRGKDIYPPEEGWNEYCWGDKN